MLQMLPIYPLESYYLSRLGRRSSRGVPLNASETQRAIQGIPCRKIYPLSVIVAYVRAVGAVMVVFPSVFFFFLVVMRLSGANDRLDTFAQIVLMIAEIVFVMGLMLSLPTYALTFRVPERERRIRQVCERVLGVAADPASVREDVVKEIDKAVAASLAKAGITDLEQTVRRPHGNSRNVLDMALVRTRAKCILGGSPETCESDTDLLLQAIDVAAA
jgi:hypothetical protein